MRRHVGESAVGKVRKSAEVLFGSWADMVGQVGGYCACLVRWASKVVAEAS